MARMKKPGDETVEQTRIRRVFESVSNHATRSEKTSWERKRTNMEKLVKQLRPLEDKIMEIRATMQPIYDEILGLREVMVEECIHPFDMLVHNEAADTITCKFCEKTVKPILDWDTRITESSLEPSNGSEENV
jgi:hypothetical protein